MSTVTHRKAKASIRPSTSKENVKVPSQEKIDQLKRENKSLLPQRSIARIAVIFSLLAIVYFSTKEEKIKIFAKQSEALPGRGQHLDCHEEYRKDLYKYEGCFPKNCGRFVTDQLITQSEADALLVVAKKGLLLGGSSGGASILDLHSGALSKGEHFIDIYKKTDAKGLFSEADFNIYKIVKMKVQQAIAQHFGVYPDKIYLTHPTFFSQITAKDAVTVHDEYWHPHVDKETYKSFHYTSLLYLNDYEIDFKGGRFIFIDEKCNRTVEPRKARVSMFTSGAENLHYVEKVTSGTRYAITISFTCDKKYAIDDPSVNKYA